VNVDSDKLARVLVDQIVVRDCYDIRRLLNNPPDVIVDIGANTGFFSLTCRILFPRSRVICVEACESTYSMLVDNLMFFGVEPKNVALSNSEYVRIKKGRDSGSNSTEDVGDMWSDVKTPGKTLKKMFDDWNVDPKSRRVLLKVDCEGAERTIVENSESEKAMLDCAMTAFEMHYSDDRGSKKWSNAMPKATGEAWIARLEKSFPGEVTYKPTTCGGVHGGILSLLRHS